MLHRVLRTVSVPIAGSEYMGLCESVHMIKGGETTTILLVSSTWNSDLLLGVIKSAILVF